MRPLGDLDGAFRGGRGRKNDKWQPYLPGSQAVAAEKVPTRLDPHVLVPLSTDLAQLKCGVHGFIELQLLLGGKLVG